MGARFAIRGGNCNNSANCGRYVNLNNRATNTNWNIGCAVNSYRYWIFNACLIPYLLVKINSWKATVSSKSKAVERIRRMKSYNHLWERFISEYNYYSAVDNATKHKGGSKRKYQKARYIRKRARKLKDNFLHYAAHFKNANHEPKIINDGIQRKQRRILVPTMNEQIIHHMIINVLQPIFMKPMYEHSYGSIPGRGAHKAKKVIERWMRKDKKRTKYVLKLDIKKYFDSIPHDILKSKLKMLIHDDRFLKLLFEVIDVTDVGIPIGFYTSQWIANWYLTDLDHYIKEKLGAKYYVRYMDDMVIFGPNKRELHRMKVKIEEYLRDELGLQLKENWQVFKLDYQGEGRDLDFMGFRFFLSRTILRRSIWYKTVRKARLLSKKGMTIYSARQMLSYLGWLKATNTMNAYRRFIMPHITFRTLRQYISRWDKSHQRRNENVCMV